VSTSERFTAFSRRITRGYVVLAIALITVVAGASSLLSFVMFASTYNQAMDSATARVEQRLQYYQSRHETLEQYAPQLVRDESHARFRIVVFGDDHKPIAGGEGGPPNGFAQAIADLLHMRGRHLHPPGGVIAIEPDLDGFMAFIERYWEVILPVGAVAVLVAWIAGRAITRRAVRPLADVTDALRSISLGDDAPKLLLESDSGLFELTMAYNEVAQRLHVASLERRRHESEMRQFIADAGHELRTPLTIFMGYLDALRSGVVQDPAAVARVQDTMLDETRKMRAIIEKLILLARMEREHPSAQQPIDLASLAERAADALRPLAGDRVSVSHEGGAMVIGDDTELYEAVKNIVENAVRYAPGSPVEVRVGHAGGEAVLEVIDRGPGMAPLDVEHAFDRFYRGSSRADVDGSGLGLAIAKRAIERMGGSISLQSAPNEGTRVTLRLPEGTAGAA
jgi:two-component system OmpR family sensor kinase